MKATKIFFLLSAITIISLFIGSAHSMSADMQKTAPVNTDTKMLNTQQPPPMAMDRRPDLIVNRVAIVTEYQDADHLRLKFTIHVKNQGVSSTADSVSPTGVRSGSRGKFKPLVEWTPDDRAYHRFCEFESPVLAAGAEYSYFCGSQVLSKGVFRRWRARADHLGWINERNETNNEKLESVVW